VFCSWILVPGVRVLGVASPGGFRLSRQLSAAHVEPPANCGWRVVAGELWLASCGWRVVAGELWLASCGWRVVAGELWLGV
jgi:hypothetical protein